MTATVGIDFGTTNCTVAHVNGDGRPKVLRDAERLEKTPSLVYYGDGEVLVGAPARNLLADSGATDPDVSGRMIVNVKRELAHRTRIALPDGRSLRPIDVAAEILRKLRRDAEQALGEQVSHAVITCPAVFDGSQRAAIRDAAIEAGYANVELHGEPNAAARAFAEWGNPVGAGALVFDIGGGTFDLSLLVRHDADDAYEVALPPDGDARCGGHDFDLALYEHWDRQARGKLGRPIGDGGRVDARFLQRCRERKENLTTAPSAEFSSRLSDGTIFSSEIDRADFERLISPWVDRTMRITKSMVERARDAGHSVDSVVLIGGSSRPPIFERRLQDDLGLDVHTWRDRDVAVAIGAALRARQVWGTESAANGAERPVTVTTPPVKVTTPPAAATPTPAPKPAQGFPFALVFAVLVVLFLVGSVLGAC